MKKLICAEDIHQYHANGTQQIPVDDQTIITPSAKDLIEEYQMSLEKISCQNPLTKDLDSEITKDQLLLLLKSILAGELPSAKFQTEKHPNGLKVVKGNSVKMDVFETGNPDANVHFQELVSQEESKMSAGFLEIERSSFEWELTYEEIDYVIEGTLTITIDGKTYTAQAGDVVFVPKNSKVVWGSPNKARIFYATYPANWADLL